MEYKDKNIDGKQTPENEGGSDLADTQSHLNERGTRSEAECQKMECGYDARTEDLNKQFKRCKGCNSKCYSPLVKRVLATGGIIESCVDKVTGEIREPMAAPIPGLDYRRINDRKLFGGIIKIGKVDVIIKRTFKGQGKIAGGVRGEITKFSRASQRRLKLAARNPSEDFKHMLTCTYPAEFPTDGRKVKRDLAAMRKWLVRRGVSGLVCLEFQERGAPHFLFLLTGGRIPKKDIATAWYTIVGSGDEKHLKYGTRIEAIRYKWAAARYIQKGIESYTAKFDQKGVPEEYRSVGRFWSRFGSLKMEADILAEGTMEEVAPIIRAVRHAYIADRRKYTKRKFRDNGRFSFVAWGIADSVRSLSDPSRLEKLGH